MQSKRTFRKLLSSLRTEVSLRLRSRMERSFEEESGSEEPRLLELENRILYDAAPVDVEAGAGNGEVPDADFSALDELTDGIIAAEVAANADADWWQGVDRENTDTVTSGQLNLDASAAASADNLQSGGVESNWDALEQFLQELEQPLPLADETSGVLTETSLEEETSTELAPAPVDGSNATQQVGELIIVDRGVEGYEQLVLDILSQASRADQVAIVYVDSTADGVAQISSALAELSDLNSVHLVSHGNNGQLTLGNTTLTANNASQYFDAITSWGNALAADADLLIYGCDLASNADGLSLLDTIAELTGADIAASDDLTGHASLGGDWELEYEFGDISADVVFSADLQSGWVQFLGESTTANENSASHHSIAVDQNGNSIGVWTNTEHDDVGGDSPAVIFQMRDFQGNLVGVNTQVNQHEAGDQKWASVASDAIGNFAVTWTSLGQDGQTSGVYARMFDNTGAPLTGTDGDEFLVSAPSATETGSNSSISMNDSGQFIIAWQGAVDGDDATGVYAQAYNADGSTNGGIIQVNTTENLVQNSVVVSLNNSGNAAFAWASTEDIVFAQRYSIGTGLVGSEIVVDTGTGVTDVTEPAVDINENGEFAVSYTETILGNSGVDVKRYFADGNENGASIDVNTELAGAQEHSQISLADDGTFIVTWHGNGPTDSDGIFKREFNSSGGAIDANEIRVNSTPGANQHDASIARYSDGSYIILYSEVQGVNYSIQSFNSSAAQINQAPEAADNTVDFTAGESYTFTTGDFGYSDFENDTFDFVKITSINTAGSFLLDGATVYANQEISVTEIAADKLVFTNLAGESGVGYAEFEFRVKDSNRYSLTDSTMTIDANNTNPAFTTAASFNINENATAVATLQATDAEAPLHTVTYSIVGGADQFALGIGATTGDLVIFSAPNYETPMDAGTDNVYNVTVRASDQFGGFTDQNLTITVQPVNETAPSFMIGNTFNVQENTADVTTVAATDMDAPTETITYSIVGGSDQLDFTIDSGTGDLDFAVTPNYEDPTDSDLDNTYNITVRADDNNGETSDLALTINVLAVNEFAPVITSSATVTVDEGVADVIAVTATDADLPAGALTYAITGGADMSRFSIGSSNGMLTFDSTTDFENPQDIGTDNVYDVTVSVFDSGGLQSISQSISVTIADVDEYLIVDTGFDIIDGDYTNITTLLASRGTDGFISLREAILAANNTPGANVIQVLAGTYVIADGSVGLLTGDFDIEDELTLIGAGTGQTNINGQGLSRVFHVDGASAIFRNMTITGGSQSGGGGGGLFVNNSSTATLENVVVNGNSAAFGGGIAVVDSTLFVRDSVVSSNTSAADGAGVLIQNAVATLERSLIAGNNSAVNGGAIAVKSATLYATDTTISGNDANNGAGVYASNSSFDIERVTFNANTALNEGGAISNRGGSSSSTLTNVTISDNDAGSLGGAIFTNSVLSVLNSTIALNDAAVSGSGFHLAGSGDLNLQNSIVSDNVGGNSNAAINSLGNNIDSGNTMGLSATGDLTNTNAGLLALAANGGYTDTHALVASSIAIGRANSAAAPATDQRDDTRDANADIGAYELTGANGNPVFTSASMVDIDENETAVLTVTADDPEGDSLWYTIVGGADQALFNVGSASGDLAFDSAPDYDDPADADMDNSYEVIVRVEDASGNTVDQTITIDVQPLDDEAPVFTTSDTVSVDENQTAVITVNATDADQPADTVTYAITGGSDLALFSIDSSTGELTFDTAPDYENPADVGLNNQYIVVVTASDGSGATVDTDQTITINVQPVNEASPVFTTSSTVSVDENQTVVITVNATDADQPADTVTYSITGGADMALFSIDSSTGELTFDTAPDYENPADVGLNNQYIVTVTASDGSGSTADTDQTITINVQPVNEASPVFTTSATVSVDENQTAVITVNATDADQPADTVTYAITGGADMALFSIDSSTGELTFDTAPDYENPADAGLNNQYVVVVTASDGSGATVDTDQTITINVQPVNEASPVFTTSSTVSVDENQTAVITVNATDADQPADTVTYAITGGADMALFSIDSSTGELTFDTAPDYENPADVGLNNQYVVIVTASDGSASTADTDQTITINVQPVNEASPVFTTSNTVSVDENQTAVITVNATDADQPADTVTYSITGGADMALFSVDSSTGELTFDTAPDYENPADVGLNNQYVVIVTASDGSGATVDTDQTITINVQPVNEASPVFTTSNTVSVDENQTAVITVNATDADQPADTVTYSITGGADMALFSIDSSTGELTFDTAPDYENPADVGLNNQYVVIVTASDGSGATVDTDQTITINVQPINEFKPTFTNSNAIQVNENDTAVVTVNTTDSDRPAETITYSITGGADAGQFAIDANTGVLTFTTGPNYETPADADTDNRYEVTVTADDNNGQTETQDITVDVQPVNESAPSFTSSATVSVNENQTSVITVAVTDTDQPAETITYSITGGTDRTKFAIDATTGELTFIAAPDYENPTDANSDNNYRVRVTANDNNGMMAEQLIVVDVQPINEASPTFTTANRVQIDENETVVTTVNATDADAPVETVTYSITGGADRLQFTIDSSTGELSFVAAADYEVPTDANGDNQYIVSITADDNNGNTSQQTVVVDVQPVNDNDPNFISLNTVSVNEQETSVMNVTATDADAAPVGSISYSLIGGADAAKFAIDPVSGMLTFQSPPEFTQPTDANGDNQYVVLVQASDGDGRTSSQTITVTVLDTNAAAPVFTSSATANVAENTTAVTTVQATDGQTNDAAIVYSITGGSDASLFTINNTTGELAFVSAPDFEDAGQPDDQYLVIVTADDGDGKTASQTIIVDVTPVNDNRPIFVSPSTINVNENTPLVGTVSATDADQSPAGPVTYSITGGADQSLFFINTVTGDLSFTGARNFENPVDADRDNQYDVIVTADDNDGLNASQAISVSVVDQQETPRISDASMNVDENAADGTPVGALQVGNHDGESHTFAIVGGDPDNLFSIDNSGRLFVAAATGLDFELQPSFSLLVQVVDPLSNIDTATITLQLNDVAEAPALSDVNLTIDEGTATGTLIGTIIAADPDTGDIVTYSWDATDGAYSLNQQTGEVRVANSSLVDFEASPQRVFSVTATDTSGNSQSADLTIDLNDIDETPIARNDSFTIDANESLNVVGGQLLSNDLDPESQTLQVAVVRGVQHGQLSLATDGSFTFTPDSNFIGIDSFTYVVTDGTNTSSEATVEINVEGVPAPVNTEPEEQPEPEEEPATTEDPVQTATEETGEPALEQGPVVGAGNEDEDIEELISNAGGQLVQTQSSTATETTVVVADETEDNEATLTEIVFSTFREVQEINTSQNSAARVVTSSLAIVQQAVSQEFVFLAANTQMWDELGRISEDIGVDQRIGQIIVPGAVGLSTAATVGYVWWGLASVVSSIQAWRKADPLAILEALDGLDSGESLESIIEKADQT